MIINATQEILDCFIGGKFKKMDCPQCENTFLTNVYEMECFDKGQKLKLHCRQCKKEFLANTREWDNYVLLEKYALGLEYFCDAIQKYQLKSVPYIRRVGVLDEDNLVIDPACIKLFVHEEPDYRLIYVMERLEHLQGEDAEFFTEHVYGIEWQDKEIRDGVFDMIEARYNKDLGEDIRMLCRYYRENSDYLGWDMHGDNLMRRKSTGEIVVLDPFTVKTEPD